MIYLIVEQVCYGARTIPIAIAKTIEELSSFLKQRGYYVGSHAQSVKAVKKALDNAEVYSGGIKYCYFYWHTGKHNKMAAGSFQTLKRIKDMTFRDKYIKEDFEVDQPTTPK
jgi:hypothetical protein